MFQLIALLLIVAALVILVLQNLTPVMGLVVFGSTLGALPVSVWLLGAIAIGVLLTLIIYQLVPQKKAYRPIGQRLSDPAPAPEPTRFVNAPVDTPDNRPSNPPPSGRFQPPDRQNPYDNNWENFRAPEQWDDWGQQRQPDQPPSSDRPRPPLGDSVGDAVRDIEMGWGDDDYESSARYAARQEADPADIGWDDGGTYGSDRGERPNYETRTYEEGWLYGNDASDNASDQQPSGEPEEPRPDNPDESVYDANYRVIIPPYDGKDS
ncbi:MAG: hypothetical protein KTR27_13495 [Leptolyngbyaceae cyanobacterium MAG.088]|nr:hypothetical protein [Leptolyngbyaceae cyanobacterium MAG.088]